ncbi:polysaccharide deacetylase family sporulation protein PdaB [Paenibacillus sp. PvR052]
MYRRPIAAFFYALIFCMLFTSCTAANSNPNLPNSNVPQSYQTFQFPEREPFPEPQEPKSQHSTEEQPPPAASQQPAAVSEKPAAPSPSKPKLAPKVKVKKDSPAPEKPAKETTSRNKALTLSQLVEKYPDLLLLKGRGSLKQVALTFDDSPDTQFTPQVLDVLKQYNVRATFFLIGSQAEKYPEIVKRIVREGHVIGNHSYDHKLFTKLTDEKFKAQVLQTQKTLKSLIGYTPRLIRPPYGEISENQLLWASQQGFRIVNWNVDSQDWKQIKRDQVTNNILNHVKTGSIVLQHTGGGPGQNLSGTVEALPTVIQTLQSRGYKLVTLPEMLQVSKQIK